MSSVKNNNDIGAALGNLWNSVAKEGKRAVDEAGKLTTESINDISKATTDGGFVGGAIQAFEELSPGNFAAGAADVLTGPGQLNPQLAAGIRGVVNLAAGAVGGPAVLLQVQSLKDAAVAFGLIGGAPMTPGAGQSPAARQTQSPEKPADAAERSTSTSGQMGLVKRKAIAEAKVEAREQIREKAQTNKINDLEARVSRLEKLLGITEEKPAGGYSAIEDIGGFGRIDFDKLKPGKIKRDVEDATSELDKILNNPNLSFEDMVFMLMSAIMKEQQAEVKAMTKDLRGKKNEFEGDKVARNARVDKAEANLANAEALAREKPNDPAAQKGLVNARTEVRKATEDRNDAADDFNSSRAEQFELIKNAMQKLTEMQQTLSNILNTMHQTAMNTIGNIR